MKNTQKSKFPRLATGLGLALLLTLTACGGHGHQHPHSGGESTQVNGFVSKAPLTGATCNLYNAANQVVATQATSDAGNSTLASRRKRARSTPAAQAANT